MQVLRAHPRPSESESLGVSRQPVLEQRALRGFWGVPTREISWCSCAPAPTVCLAFADLRCICTPACHRPAP